MLELNINNCILRAGTLVVQQASGISKVVMVYMEAINLLMSMFVISLHLTSFQFDLTAKQEASTRSSAFCQVAEPKDISKQNNVA